MDEVSLDERFDVQACELLVRTLSPAALPEDLQIESFEPHWRGRRRLRLPNRLEAPATA